jgi:hypothetical protein
MMLGIHGFGPTVIPGRIVNRHKRGNRNIKNEVVRAPAEAMAMVGNDCMRAFKNNQGRNGAPKGAIFESFLRRFLSSCIGSAVLQTLIHVQFVRHWGWS